MSALRLASALLVSAVVLVASGCSDDPEESGPDVDSSSLQPTSESATTTTQSDPTSDVPDTSSPETGGSSVPPPGTPTVSALPPGVELTAAQPIAEDLDVPWGIAFLPNGDSLVTERDTARLLEVGEDGEVAVVGTVPGVTPTLEGGLLGVAVSPDYSTDGTVYLYATTAQDNRVLMGTLDDVRAGNLTAILTDIPRGDIHNGGRLAFGPDGMLYVTTGETGVAELAPDLDSLGGKVLRIEPGGGIPADNPFPDSPVWSYGHRNVQGLTWDDDGRLWTSEFGSELWDEINLVKPGKNYGWPAAEGTADLPGLTDPAAVFTTDSASPSGLAFANGALWMAALQGETTWRVPVGADGTLRAPEPVRIADARTRTVVAAPDGRLWITTSQTDGRAEPEAGDDSIVAITP